MATQTRMEEIISQTIDTFSGSLRELSLKIHQNPELCYGEHMAHDAICNYLVKWSSLYGITVIRKAYGLETSFLAEYVNGDGEVVDFCAEYDALPEIGHGCGHNLIAISSIASFLGLAAVMERTGIPGKVRLLGTPAEEGGGGKIKLIEAGALKYTTASLMSHPTPQFPHMPAGSAGVAFGSCLAATGLLANFTGKPAHAAQMPWAGVNALDAATLAYQAVGLLRQHIRPSDRINIIIPEGGTAHNIIPDKAQVRVNVRSETLKEMNALRERVENCMKGAALATGCAVDIVPAMDPYADIRPNESLCTEFTRYMGSKGMDYYCDLQKKDIGAFSTDMGNISYKVPSFHGHFFIPTPPGTAMHTEAFRDAAKTEEAHDIAMSVGKGMAVAGLKVLADKSFAAQMKEYFEDDKEFRY
ncbi:amidohydrolase [Aspergillus piperis CBS 112811]|uniref:Peptidase M20 domain-containing protein 2 n=1 Tax=Aspergillus piperis CBS 112811 TaxID=1448313 RepID=A0A8G1RDQ6_9EURO|nr:amidohydrolase [Aspergillus piperis CBS 112811]RAH61390.1 amidohydrolase [Aspergillus piperis CBS 112811]